MMYENYRNFVKILTDDCYCWHPTVKYLCNAIVVSSVLLLVLTGSAFANIATMYTSNPLTKVKLKRSKTKSIQSLIKLTVIKYTYNEIKGY